MKLHLGENRCSIPRVLSKVYKYARFDAVYSLRVGDSDIISINPEKQLTDAWKHIAENCAKSEKCNDYFKKLHRTRSLSDIMEKDELVFHLLTPIGKYTENDLPMGNGAGKDIGISLFALIDGRDDVKKMAATVLHEIAHYAGASTDPEGAQALQAENSLVPCGLKPYFNKDAKG
ncbi:MAG: hypothetical protein QM776_08240 [Rhodocyclaceae bacterium]